MSTWIVGAGLVTPIGLSLAESAPSARARVARLRAIDWLDRRFEPFIVGTVPDDGLPELNVALAGQPIQSRESRMLRMAHAAIADAMNALPALTAPPPLLLGLPEHHTAVPVVAERFLQRLALQSGPCVDLGASISAPRGRAAGLMALKQAERIIAGGQRPFVLVGGVDSLVDPYVLGNFDNSERVRGENVSDGFSPSEGAAFLLLADPDAARALSLTPLAILAAAATGQEPGHLYSEAPYLGEGLAAAVGEALEGADIPAPISTIYSSFNGERYWAREFGVARIRNAAAFADDAQMEHPAECFGDLGAAHGVALAALASHALAQGYRRGPALVYASSDHADRAAAVLLRPS